MFFLLSNFNSVELDLASLVMVRVVIVACTCWQWCAGSIGKPRTSNMWLGCMLLFCPLLMVCSSRPGPNGLGLIGSSECGGSRLLLALPPAGDALLATVGNLKAFPHILCPVSVWCCQVGFIVSHSEVISFMYVGKLGSWPTIG